MGYDAATTQREAEKGKQAWKVITIVVTVFLVIGSTIWFGGVGGKY